MLSDDNQLVVLRSTLDEQCNEIKQLKEVNDFNREKISRLTKSKESLLQRERFLNDKLTKQTDENRNLAAQVAVKRKIIEDQNVRYSIYFEKC